MQLFKIGECTNCGECCNILSPDGNRGFCEHYDPAKKEHCKIYPTRPHACRNFPRGPMDNNRMECGFKFMDDRGNVVDGFMDKRVRLTPIPKPS